LFTAVDIFIFAMLIPEPHKARKDVKLAIAIKRHKDP